MFCVECGESKLQDQFYKSKANKDGHTWQCKPCKNEQNCKWAKAHPVAHKAINNRYKKAHPEVRVAEYERNKDKVSLKSSQWRKANPEARRKIVKRWALRNPDKRAAKERRRQVMKLGAIPKWADHSEILGFYSRAEKLRRETGKDYHVDHIVPLRSEIVCGLHVQHNLQILDAIENIKKGNRRWPDMPGCEGNTNAGSR